jgi:hypothetical protein
MVVHAQIATTDDRPVRPDPTPLKVELLEVREDKPISTLHATISNQDDVVVLEATGLVERASLCTAANGNRWNRSPRRTFDVAAHPSRVGHAEE